MRAVMHRLAGAVGACLRDQRGQDVIVVLLVIFLIWLLVTGRQVIVR